MSEIEKRTLTLEKMHKREDNGKIYLEGYFARFNEPYKLCEGWIETISPGAFTRYLESGGEVKVLWNHNHDIVLGSRDNGTLVLEEHATGLYGRVEINQKDSAAMDAYARIARGDVSGCSFGFDCQTEQSYDKDGTYRTIIREVYPLYEVSPCTFPAYETTLVEARSRLDEVKKRETAELNEWRSNLRKVLKRNSSGSNQSCASASERALDAEDRKDISDMRDRRNFFGMSQQERDIFFARNDVKNFLHRMRDLVGVKRTVSGAELMVPEIVLELIREGVSQFSKLYKYVNVKHVPGSARQNIMGSVPEAIWTEVCASVNELNLSFTSVEVDGYKVGGYIAICNAILEDSDIALASEIISALGQAIGLALDKAILYGTGTKMPMGIVTRLAQTEITDNGPVLNDSNLVAVSGLSDFALFKTLVELCSIAKNKLNTGGKFWAMNESTYTKLLANAVSFDETGLLVSSVDSVMPVVGGAIEVLPFIPDGDIVGGYGGAYLLAERAGVSVAQSEHVRFIENQTVFKGIARYDGAPIIPESFVVVNISGIKPAADVVEFIANTAN